MFSSSVFRINKNLFTFPSTGVLKCFWLATKLSWNISQPSWNVKIPCKTSFLLVRCIKSQIYLLYQIWRPLFGHLVTLKRAATPSLRTAALVVFYTMLPYIKSSQKQNAALPLISDSQTGLPRHTRVSWRVVRGAAKSCTSAGEGKGGGSSQGRPKIVCF